MSWEDVSWIYVPNILIFVISQILSFPIWNMWRIIPTFHATPKKILASSGNIKMPWHLLLSMLFSGLVVKNAPANAGDAGDMGSIPGSGRSSGGGNGNPLQYSCLENSMDRGTRQTTVHRVTKSQTWLSTQACYYFHFNNNFGNVICSSQRFFPFHQLPLLEYNKLGYLHIHSLFWFIS